MKTFTKTAVLTAILLTLLTPATASADANDWRLKLPSGKEIIKQLKQVPSRWEKDVKKIATCLKTRKVLSMAYKQDLLRRTGAKIKADYAKMPVELQVQIRTYVRLTYALNHMSINQKIEIISIGRKYKAEEIEYLFIDIVDIVDIIETTINNAKKPLGICGAVGSNLHNGYLKGGIVEKLIKPLGEWLKDNPACVNKSAEACSLYAEWVLLLDKAKNGKPNSEFTL